MFANILVDTLCWSFEYELPRLTSHLQHSLVKVLRTRPLGQKVKQVCGIGSRITPIQKMIQPLKVLDILLFIAGCLDINMHTYVSYPMLYYGIIQLNQLRLDSTSHFSSLVVVWLRSILSEMPSVHATTFWGDEMIRNHFGGLVVGSKSLTLLLTTYGIWSCNIMQSYMFHLALFIFYACGPYDSFMETMKCGTMQWQWSGLFALLESFELSLEGLSNNKPMSVSCFLFASWFIAMPPPDCVVSSAESHHFERWSFMVSHCLGTGADMLHPLVH